MKNELIIEHVGVVSSRGHKLWVNLTCGNDTRQVCYVRYSNAYTWEDGDKEPEMPTELRDAFHGIQGEKALQKCARTGETQILTV